MLSDNIRKYRKENNMSQDELAEKLGVSRQSVSLWENEQTQPTIDNIVALAKIFNVSTDAILENNSGVKILQEEGSMQKRNTIIPIIIAVAASVMVCVILFVIISAARSNTEGLKNRTKEVVATDSETTAASSTEIDGLESSDTNVSGTSPSKSKSEKAASAATSSNVPKSNPSTVTPSSSDTSKSKTNNTFDLFTYCKNFAISKGTLKGDYSMYQQPATRYGGYSGEYFSISYWGDSDMVEFCLHCPLDETYSINFYLRMRGGYNKKYEYLSSRYYRDTGASLRSASGYIDPAVFSDNYPLSCDKYEGSSNGQSDFMEESRIGMCDLIHCLKKFVEVENMECDFSAFDFVNF